MRYLLAFLLIPCAARAQQGVQNVHEIALSTNTITQTIINLSSMSTTDVSAVISSGTVPGYYKIEACNVANSTTTLVVCGFDIALSTNPAEVWYGREITSGNCKEWPVGSNRHLYCRSKLSTNNLTITEYK